MNEIAEKGLAAHWKYKGIKGQAGIDQWIEKVREALKSSDVDANNLIEDLKLSQFSKEIFVFTPNGDLKKFPENARLGMIYARTLLQSGQYKRCYEFLSDYELLPYEGATEGRNIYHESCIRLAVKELSAGDYNRSIHYAQKAKEWPENLGVGKPYDVDERLDNYLTAMAHEKSGNKKKAQEFYQLVADHSMPGYINENAGLLLQLKVLDRFDAVDQATQLLHRSIELAPENPYLRWVASVYKNNGNRNQIRKEISNYESTLLPYDTKFIDENFALLLDILEIIE